MTELLEVIEEGRDQDEDAHREDNEETPAQDAHHCCQGTPQARPPDDVTQLSDCTLLTAVYRDK